MRWAGLDGFEMVEKGDGSKQETRECKKVCKTSLMLMPALAKLTTVQVDGCRITVLNV